jgi:hypothetical protein
VPRPRRRHQLLRGVSGRPNRARHVDVRHDRPVADLFAASYVTDRSLRLSRRRLRRIRIAGFQYEIRILHQMDPPPVVHLVNGVSPGRVFERALIASAPSTSPRSNARHDRLGAELPRLPTRKLNKRLLRYRY